MNDMEFVITVKLVGLAGFLLLMGLAVYCGVLR